MKSKIKNIIKGGIYSDLLKVPRFWFRKVKVYINNKKHINYINNINCKPKTQTLKIAFVLKFPEIWNSSKTVFESFRKQENVEVFIIAINNGENNVAYSFAKSFCKNVIYWDDTRMNYEKLDIDYVFFTRPYDKDYPQGLKPSYVSQYSKICYIPYGFEFVTGYHIEVEYDYLFLPFAYMIFCEGDSSYSYCKKILPNDTSTKLLRSGFPRFDLLKEYTHKKGKTNKILWTPRWSIEKIANDGTSFFLLIEPLISFFSSENMKNYNLVIRPHPLMFNNFIKNNLMTLQDISELKNRISKCRNISFDVNVNYLESASQADLIISDFSGMLIEFLMLNKPVIYCGRTDNFDDTGKEMNSVMYHINSEFDIKRTIVDYLDKGDILKNQREMFIKKMGVCNNLLNGEKIVKVILSDYYEKSDVEFIR